MNDELSKEERKLTFSQREGKVPLPEALKPRVLSKKFRKNLWAIVEPSISNNQTIAHDLGYIDYLEIGVEPPDTYTIFCDSHEGKFWQEFSYSYYFKFLDKNHDEILVNESGGPHEFKNIMRDLILDGEYHEVLTAVEYMLRFKGIPKKLNNKINLCFDETLYVIDDSSTPICILPAASEEMKKHVKLALDNISQSQLVGAKSHIREAAQFLNDERIAHSIRESIHAVAAAIGQISPENKNNFSKALNSLEKNGLIKHPALKEAFRKLYAYTSDEKGIRHWLIDTESANVGFDEAIFMYGACISFVDYLVNKQRQMEENERT